jgi:hypothetical protein
MPSLTVRALTDFASKEFLPWSEANHSPSHNKLQASIVRVHLSPYFKGRHLDEITPTLVEDYVTQRWRGRYRTGRKTKPWSLGRSPHFSKRCPTTSLPWWRARSTPA